MFQSRISVIQGHNKDNNTDDLYEPLRKTFLVDTTAKKTFLDDASRISHISNVAKANTLQENKQLGQRTFILEDVRLRPSHDLSILPQNKKYKVINASEKSYQPISPEELEKKIKQKKQDVIVYVYGNEQQKVEKIEKVDAKPPVQQKKVRKGSGIKLVQPKYNLFSVIDEPFNNVLSGKPCTCPANELIASYKTQVDWNNIKHHDQQLFE